MTLRLTLLITVQLALAAPAWAGVIYSSDSGGRLWKTDSATAASTLVGNTGQTQIDVAFSPGGVLYGTTFGFELYKIDSATAAATLVGNLGQFVNALDFSPEGVAYGAGGNSLVTINVTTGAATVVGTMGAFQSAGDLAFAPDGTLFMTTTSHQLVKVNRTNAAVTPVGAIGFTNVFGIDFIGNALYGITESGQLLTINTATGAGTLVTAANVGYFCYGASVNPVPEPSTAALAAIASMIVLGRSPLGRAMRSKGLCRRSRR